MEKHLFKVVLCDDHFLYRTKLKNVLCEKEDIRVVAEATNGMQLLSVLSHIKPDVILLDVRTLVADEFRLCLSKVKKRNPFIKVIALTLYDMGDTFVRLREMGVETFLSRNSEPDAFYEAIMSGGEHKNVA